MTVQGGEPSLPPVVRLGMIGAPHKVCCVYSIRRFEEIGQRRSGHADVGDVCVR
jgi:hypothetical protein